MKTEPNEPINAIVEEVEHGMSGTTMDATSYGLTKRQYFAAAFMQGLLSNPNQVDNTKHFTKDSVGYADDLINALNTTP